MRLTIETEDGAQVLEVNGSFGISDEMNKIIGEGCSIETGRENA